MKINKNRKSVLILLLIITSVRELSYSQIQNDDNISISHLIGLLSDYGGKNYIPDHPEEKNRITQFYFQEKKSLEAFRNGVKNSSLSMENFDFKLVGEDTPETVVYSKKYYSLFNEYYKFRKMNYPYTDEKDNDYIFFNGKLNKSKFRSISAKMQFLKGAFERDGSVNENGEYQFTFANPGSKHKIVCDFLKATGSKILSKRDNGHTTPSSYKIVFEPSEKLKLFFDK